ncbi:hypothetical protein O181_001805 [Austropuccinia psidii MF-1]|uniref:Uncharacterized protein n=1 Tax=Austropuccinia psidii MF-1 TaxID=1389203 RepID=A0A9Q3BBT7_9BASI|nr:hypothetical protein [Austropuccinia psidii MF-1]
MFHGPRKEIGPSEGLDTHFLPRESPKYKILAEKPKHFVREPEEIVGPKVGQQPSGGSSSLQKKKSTSKSARKVQESPKEQPEGQAKVKSQVEQNLPTELQDSKEEKTTMDNMFNMSRTLM